MSIKRAILYINGLEREIICNEQDLLVDVLRRQGLTGTKAACRSGHCGACSLILDGKLTRACLRKMKSIEDYSVIETIEGVGTATDLHPLQQAFLTYAAVQCGFCSPGFILSAKALLLENSNPSRQEVREWFTKHNNICRCTGYKPIIDAVMEAAAVMRGEKTICDIKNAQPANNQIYGSDFQKPKGVSRVIGACDFGADIALKMPVGTQHLAVVIAKTHRAVINNIDTAKALAMPGVNAVITAKDVKGSNRFFAPQGVVHSLCHGKERPIIVDKEVFRYGDIVAVVAANSREEARAAANHVNIEYTQKKPMLNFLEAVAQNAEQIHEGIENVYMELPLYKGEDTKELLKNENLIVAEGSFSTTRQPHLPIEPDVIQAYPHGDGVAIQCKTQFIYGIIGQMAEGIGLEPKNIRVIGNPAGGSFGYSMSPANYAVTAVCALALNAPVSLDMSYEEHQHTTGKRAPVYTNMRLACDKDGKLQAMDSMQGIDHGAYSEMAGALTTKVLRFIGYYYDIPNIRALARTAFTNSNFGTAYRAFGSPQAYMASEQIIEMLAEKMNMDPFEFRYKNLAREGVLSTTSVPYRDYVMPTLMDMARPYYEAGKKKAKELSTDSVKYGVGISLGGYHVSKVPDASKVDLELRKDGGVNVYSCWADVGQGADFGLVAHTHESLKCLDLKIDQIHLIMNDTGTCPDTGSASGSRSHHAAGLAIIDAANKMMTAMKKENGSFRTWSEMEDEGLPTRFNGLYEAKWSDLDPNTGHGYSNVAQNYVVTVVEVSVDTKTGNTIVENANIISDVGVIGSTQAVLGQAWGGFAHSIGYALSEDYDDMQKHQTLRGAGVVRCIDVPDEMNVHFNVTPRENGPHGSTGCSEGFQSNGHVAIINAIKNATGVRITTLPATPEKIKEGLAIQANGQEYKQEKYDLGCELYERLEYLHNKYVVNKK